MFQEAIAELPELVLPIHPLGSQKVSELCGRCRMGLLEGSQAFLEVRVVREQEADVWADQLSCPRQEVLIAVPEDAGKILVELLSI